MQRNKPDSLPPADSSELAARSTPKNPKSQRRMQMADIARLAGVSTSTVSRALSGSALIPETTRTRIVELARSMNYRINVGAANLRKRDIQTIGVVILGDSMQSISDPFLLSVVGTVADALDERGMSLLLSRMKEGAPEQLAAIVESGQVGGLVVIGQLTWHERLNRLAEMDVPMAVWGARLPDALYSTVGSDNLQGGYLATRHLVERGCRHIAFFGDINHPEAGLRYQGYTQALHEAGLRPDPRLHQSFLFNDTRIRHVIDQWLDQHLEFDAIFASSDVCAVSIMGALSERGIAVPAQVRLVGYDDIALAEHLHPPLSSVRQPAALAGRALVDLLFEAMAGAPRRSVMLPTELMERESSR